MKAFGLRLLALLLGIPVSVLTLLWLWVSILTAGVLWLAIGWREDDTSRLEDYMGVLADIFWTPVESLAKAR